MMKTVAILAALVGSATAFAPSQQGVRSTTSLEVSFEKELGVQKPLGYWCVHLQ
jgi:hypothetical protein